MFVVLLLPEEFPKQIIILPPEGAVPEEPALVVVEVHDLSFSPTDYSSACPYSVKQTSSVIIMAPVMLKVLVF